ncbi:AGE family epimerase/isomerase [Aquidulcibacter paucihalophilus]|uniref:AGE family epimerase/isomerase n=1 Tax=Aquidulcibacter paucihalophilus TaxID=1978549 RepID=UPI000A191473|nr:AGE family epimerase/isomerase [Aquidulcibacter paucihalophilus]
MTDLDALAPPLTGSLDRVAQAALGALEDEARAELDRICDWWATHAPAPTGGFWGEIGENGLAYPEAPRAIILNARLLWFFSAAFEATGHAACGRLADQAYAILIDHFLDPDTETLIWMVSAENVVLDARKQTYAQAFGIYALAAYARAKKHTAALASAVKIFEQVQTHFMDCVHGGWIEALGPDLEPIEDVRLSARDQNAPKSMNTHLHILEAYTGLHEALQQLDPHHVTGAAVCSALEMAFEIFNQHVVSRGRDTLGLFFDWDWTRQSAVRSYGHDIEASWLVYEAGLSLATPARLAEAKETCLGLATGALTGLSEFGGLYEELGPDGHLSRLHVWWIQAEALVGFLNAYTLTHDPVFLKHALGVWGFIKDHQIDTLDGEWLELSRLDDQSSKSGLMAGPRKCPYHTGRAMIETIRLCQGLQAAR